MVNMGDRRQWFLRRNGEIETVSPSGACVCVCVLEMVQKNGGTMKNLCLFFVFVFVFARNQKQ